MTPRMTAHGDRAARTTGQRGRLRVVSGVKLNHKISAPVRLPSAIWLSLLLSSASLANRRTLPGRCDHRPSWIQGPRCLRASKTCYRAVSSATRASRGPAEHRKQPNVANIFGLFGRFPGPSRSSGPARAFGLAVDLNSPDLARLHRDWLQFRLDRRDSTQKCGQGTAVCTLAVLLSSKVKVALGAAL